MKRKLVGLLTGVLVIFGCNNDVEKPAADAGPIIRTVNGEVTVSNVTGDRSSGHITATVTGTTVDAIVTITGTETPTGTQTMATLTDASGQLLYSIETIMNEQTGEITYTESTDTDYLTFGMRVLGERMRESYDANGDQAVFEYPLISEDDQCHAVNYYQHGLPETGLPPDIVEYVGEARAFDTYYQPHYGSSIHDNPDGDMLVQIVTSPEFAQVVIGEPPTENFLASIGQMCRAFSTCAAFACRFAPGHPICNYCFLASMACSILMILFPGIGS